MLQIQPKPDEAPLSIEILIELYLKLDFPKIFWIFQNFLPSSVETQKSNPPYLASIFLEWTRHIVSMMSCILGYFADEYIDASIQGFLSIFYPRQCPAFTFNFAQYLSDSIHEQLVKLPEEGMFKYSSILFHMFLYFQSERFAVSLQKLETEGNPQSIVFWTSLIRKDSTEFTYKDFIDSFIHPVPNTLRSSSQPRINEEMKKILQLLENSRTRDWYLYQNHTEIRVYGCQLTPYKLPKYLPMRLFVLEYIREILNSYEVNFLSAKKKTQFKIKNQIGPFIINNRNAGQQANKCL